MLKMNSIGLVSRNVTEIKFTYHISIYLPIQSDNRYRYMKVRVYTHTLFSIFSIFSIGYLYKTFLHFMLERSDLEY